LVNIKINKKEYANKLVNQIQKVDEKKKPKLVSATKIVINTADDE